MNILRRKSFEDLMETTEEKKLTKALGAFDITLMGLGIIIGTGIFVLTGIGAAKYAGPGLMLSFVLAAVTCTFVCLAYSELASFLPVSGSSYTYAYASLGEVFGWWVGWSLILEYSVGASAVAGGWSAYFVGILHSCGIDLPKALTAVPAEGGLINLPAAFIVLVTTALLVIGVKESTRVNRILVYIKIGTIFVFLFLAAPHIEPANWQPFLPYGIHGVAAGTAVLFFAYLGFDCVSSSAAEVKNPKRNMPLGIIGTLAVATILYTGVAVVLTGMVKYTKLDVANPVAFALQAVHQNWLAALLSIGALIGMATMMFTMIYSSSRLIYSISRDGLLPSFLNKLDDKTSTPKISLWIVAAVIAVMGGLVSLDRLTDLVNIGTLLAFTLVSFGIIPLRKRKDIGNQGGFRVPWFPVLPIISGCACLFMMSFLSLDTWIGAGIWFLIGLVLYFGYGYRHSKLATEE